MSESVVIVGGGTSGLMLGYELGLAGVDAIILESAVAPPVETPSVAINTTSVELLEQRGLMDSLSEYSVPMPAVQFALTWLDIEPLGGRFNAIIDQARLNERLRQAAADVGVRVHFDQRVVGLTQDDAGVTVTVRCSGREREVRCAYLVGCDGENSVIRDLCAIAYPGQDPAFDGIVGDVTVDFEKLPDNIVGSSMYPNGLIMCMPSGSDTLRVVTARFGTDPARPGEPVTVEELLTQIEWITGGTITAIESANWLKRYRNMTRNAEHYRAGRVFLVGDAAHTFFPFGGQRLNLCMQDAVNLGWKLAAQIRGSAPPGLLDTYHAERHPVGERACRMIKAQVALVQSADDVDELRETISELTAFPDVNRSLLEFVTGLDVRYPMGPQGVGATRDVHPLLGARLPLAAITTANGCSAAAAALRSGHGAVFDLSDGAQDVADVAAWASRVDLVTARPTPAIGATALLIRPDGHVAWLDTTTMDTEGLTTALRTWFGAPAADATT